IPGNIRERGWCSRVDSPGRWPSEEKTCNGSRINTDTRSKRGYECFRTTNSPVKDDFSLVDHPPNDPLVINGNRMGVGTCRAQSRVLYCYILDDSSLSIFQHDQ